MDRRDFLWLLTASVGASTLEGCAVDPVTGRQTLMLMSESQEISIDQQQSPQQFSSDYGPVQDASVNAYLSEVGNRLARLSHRPGMPYSFRAVNASYVNAYAFPGGSIAATRGILAEIDNEAQLGALLGHEIGHVNARHTAEHASKAMVTQVAVAGVGVAAQASGFGGLSSLAEDIGNIGAGALLAHYSRENEREADALGMEYLHRAGLNPEGMVGLHEILQRQSRERPSAIELMFSTHPMSDERVANAREAMRSRYAGARGLPFNRERYQDRTAGVRRIKGALQAMQRADTNMRKKNYSRAEQELSQALKQAPNDYAALVMMSKCQIGLKRPDQAQRYANQAKSVYPREAQGHRVGAVSSLMRRDYDRAYQDLNTYDQLLPGNADIAFLKGVSLEGMQNRQGAAREYARYIKAVPQGAQSRYAVQRLQKWGYLR